MVTSDSIPPGHNLAGYKILDQVGKGGMSVVYRARHDALNRTVAIKFLTTEMSENESDRQAFKFETQAAARINHPNVVQLFDAGALDSRPYYVMEYVSGANLGELIHMRGKMEEEDALLIAEKIAEALQYCWLNHRLIHCDVKPENIIVDIHGNVKLTDLGLARIDGLTHQDAHEEYTVGTPAYMSPEQAIGLNDLDLRTDIYALGALLYHMVTGYRLFEGESDTEVAHSQVRYAVEDVHIVNPSISPAFAWMVERMLVKDRNERYSSWEDVLADIQCVKTQTMIRGGVFEANQSTMDREEGRTVPPIGRVTPPLGAEDSHDGVTPHGPLMREISTAEGQKKIRVPIRQKGSSYSPDKSRKEHDPGKAFTVMLVMGVLVVVLYAVSYMKLQLDRSAPQDTAASSIITTTHTDTEPESSTTTERHFSPSEPRPLPTVTPTPLPASTHFGSPVSESLANTGRASSTPSRNESSSISSFSSSTTTDGPSATWDHSEFQQAVKVLEASQNQYEAYLQNPGNAAVLDRIEQNCNSAIQVFKKLKDQAPPDSDIAKHTQKAYTLLANCQWTKQML